MARDDHEVLDRLAAAITDDIPVDWDHELAEHPEIAPRLERLRLIQRIAEVHQGAGREESSAEFAPIETPLFVWGHLEVLEILGEGGFGIVYRARDPQLRCDVALKLLHDDRVGHVLDTQCFLAEAQRMAQVRHPNVVAIHGAAAHDGHPGFWMDLLSGETLGERLDREGPLGAGEAAAIGLDLCRALAAVHEAGIVHGDVKTANVVRTDGGRIVLTDFGAGRERLPWLEPAGVVRGTPLSLAPELFDGSPPAPATDLYALGVLLYHLVTGRYPVTAASLDELRRRVREGEHTPLLDLRPDLPAAFAAVVERALAPRPEDRFRTAGELGAALSACLRDDDATGTEAQAAPSRLRRRLLLAVAAAVPILVALLLLWPDRASEPVPDSAVHLACEAVLCRSLEGAREELAEGALVRPGDTLCLEYRGSADANVYVLNEDREGEVHLLFPLPGQDLRNPLPGEVRLRLPGPREGVPQDWQVTGGQGREAFLVIASRDLMPWLEEVLAGFTPASADRAVRRTAVTPTSPTPDRSVTAIVPSTDAEVGAGTSRLEDLAHRLASESADPGRLWTRMYVIFNAGR
jgi:hypothetical protein